MTAESIVVDTNILVFQLGGSAKAEMALQGLNVHISFVTEIRIAQLFKKFRRRPNSDPASVVIVKLVY